MLCFLFLFLFRASSYSGSFLPPALYVLLCGSGSSLLKESVMYAMILSIHGAMSPVRTYRSICKVVMWVYNLGCLQLAIAKVFHEDCEEEGG